MVKSDGKNEVTVDVPVEQHDINAVYASELKILATKAPKEVATVNEDQKQEDYYKNFRTNVSGADETYEGDAHWAGLVGLDNVECCVGGDHLVRSPSRVDNGRLTRAGKHHVQRP